ncbi:hypothetical protein Bca52824_086973 [Brassica carinata]|uniref:Leucine-rich repeat-containing N-terminal plant-type domain-containing protein n=1 Tax=Brassica carinata TaxID=52824 RepID=A0A8X7P9T2_BRACI|nr:hypothetical protein Bca52824_086973 [Brassica carinata]
MHGYRSCLEKERKGLLELNAYVNSEFPYDWPNDTDSDCCQWERVKCNFTTGSVVGLFLNSTYTVRPLLNISLLYPFGELKTLNLDYFNYTGCCENKFSGTLEEQGLCQLKILRELDLSRNEVIGRLPQCFSSLTKLEVLDISSNKFSGTSPYLISNPTSLQYLSFSDNEFEGVFSVELITNLSKLKVFKLSSRTSFLQIENKIPLQPRFQLSVIELQYCNLETVPRFLQHQKDLRLINLSNNKLTGISPSWFLENYPRLQVLPLQNNSFTMLQLPRLLLNHNNNQFTGIGDGLLNSTVLKGTIPSSLFNIPFKLLDLSRNKFSGSLPSNFSGRHMGLFYLHDNEFRGPVPSTLLENVMLLDLRNNKLSGTIPHFVSNRYILYLLLSGNTLTGHIPTSLCDLKSIKVLDLSNNKLNGSIPSCLNNVSFGRSLDYEIDPNHGDSFGIAGGDNDLEAYSMSFVSRFLDLPLEFYLDYSGYLDFSVEFTSKRRYDSYTGESFDFIFGLDFSDNELSGEIPRELGDLQKMRALNLSYNSLSGLVPESFSNLTDKESIDLSSNVLNGSIPHNLTKLDYLVIFNVSHNNLSSSIPSQGKFLTLDETNYIGNPFLCGSPVNRSCDDNNTTGEKETNYRRKDGGVAIDMEMFYWSLGASYSVILVTFIVFLCFDSSWRRAWFRLVDAFINCFKCV